MNRTLLIIACLLVAAVAVADENPAAESAVKVIHAGTQTHCPIGGGEVDHDVYIDHQGQRVYFCCPGCEKTYVKDPEASLAKIAAKGQTVASVQAACPVSGKSVDPAVSVEHQGRMVFFCCGDCTGKFTADPAKYIAELK
jgi:YHS domain-containing protein